MTAKTTSQLIAVSKLGIELLIRSCLSKQRPRYTIRCDTVLEIQAAALTDDDRSGWEILTSFSLKNVPTVR